MLLIFNIGGVATIHKNKSSLNTMEITKIDKKNITDKFLTLQNSGKNFYYFFEKDANTGIKVEKDRLIFIKAMQENPTLKEEIVVTCFKNLEDIFERINNF